MMSKPPDLPWQLTVGLNQQPAFIKHQLEGLGATVMNHSSLVYQQNCDIRIFA